MAWPPRAVSPPDDGSSLDQGTARRGPFERCRTSASGSTSRVLASVQSKLGAARGVLATLYKQGEQYPEAVDQCREALKSDPKDQTALYRLIQALRKTRQQGEIPDLLTRLAQLREQATKEERERYRYKLIEEEPPAGRRAQPSPSVVRALPCLWFGS
jgi:hypothetical protein